MITENVSAKEINNEQNSRRDFLKKGLFGAALASAPVFGSLPASAARMMMPDTGNFNISFRNIHTGESFSGSYRVGDKYLPDAFEQINYVLRDFRTKEIFPIDPRVIDILYMVQRKTEKSGPMDVLSGYRSSKTNAMLSRASSGVAKNSLHMVGQAIDFRFPGYSTSQLRNIAVGLKAGGVGYYKRSDFVHVDTGRVRQW